MTAQLPNLTRRAMLGGGAASMLALALPAAARRGTVPEKFRGLQLYTVRSAFQPDPFGTLRRVREIGYRYVETAGLAGKTAAELKAAMDSLGLQAVSSHVNPDDWYTRVDAALDEVAVLGARYVVVPWTRENERGNWPGFADKLNGWAAKAKARGLKLAYHNHEFELAGAPGARPLEVLMAHTDPALVDFELDVHWVAVAKADPVALIRANPKRIRMLHLKDRTSDNKQRPVGSGVDNFPAILRAAAATGIAYGFVEQDDVTDAFAEITASRRYLEKL